MLRFQVLNICYLLYILIYTTTCNSQNQKQFQHDNKSNPIINLSEQSPNIDNKVKTTYYGESDIVSSGLLDKAGNLWFGTTNEGVYKYDGKTFTNYLKRDGLCDNEVWSMIEDKNGNIWFGTGNGLCKYDGKTFTSLPIPWDGENNLWGKMCNPNLVMSLLEDRLGNIWIGTCGGGSYRYDGKIFTNFLADKGRKQSDSLHHNLIKSIIEDKDGNIWFTSLTHGAVSRYDGESFTHFSAKDGLNDDMVFCSHEDKEGNIWFGCIQTIDGGLYRYDGKSFRNFSKEDGLCDNFIMSLFEDKNGKIWIGTGNGLCIFNGKNIEPFPTNENISIPEIRFFTEDKEGNLWFGGRYGSLWFYDGKTLTDFKQKRG